MTLRLRRLNRERASDVLIESFADDEIAGHAILALGKLKLQKARTPSRTCFNLSSRTVRSERSEKSVDEVEKMKRPIQKTVSSQLAESPLFMPHRGVSRERKFRARCGVKRDAA
jgi:hypothetical protein